MRNQKLAALSLLSRLTIARAARAGTTSLRAKLFLPEALEERRLLSVAYVSPTFAGDFNGQVITDADFGTAGNQGATFGVNAFTTIGAALNAVNPSGQVIVNSGTYAETVSVIGTRTLTITGANVAQTVVVNSLSTIAGTTVQIQGSSSLTEGNASSTAVSGLVTGSGSLIKSGLGTLTLGGANNYSGGTNINQGTVIITKASGLGSASSTTTVGNGSSNATLELNAPTGVTIAENIKMDGGSGTGSTLDFAGTDLTLSGALTFIKPSQAETVEVDGSSNQSTLSGHLSDQNGGARPLTKTGLGDLTITLDNGAVANGQPASFGSDTHINAGQVHLENGNGLGDGTFAHTITIASGAALELDGSITVPSGLSLDVTGSGISGSGAIHAIGSSGFASGVAGSVTLESAATVIGVDGNGTTTFSGQVSGPGGLTKVGTGTLALSNASNSYAGVTTVSNGTLQDGVANAVPITTALTINGGAFDLHGFAQTVASLSDGGVAAGSALTNSSATTAAFTDNDSGSHTFGGVISGPLNLIMNGVGTLTLSGSNSYSGGTNINQGTVIITKASGLGSASSTTTVGNGSSNATLELNAPTGVTIAENIKMDGGSGTGSTLDFAGTDLTLSGALTFIKPSQAETVEVDGSSNQATLSGHLSDQNGGARPLTKTGLGDLTISADNGFADNGASASFGSDTHINAGQVHLQASNALGDGTFAHTITVASGAALELDENITVPAGLSLDVTGSGISGTGAIHAIGSSGFASGVAGSVTLESAATVIGVDGNGTTTFSGQVSGPGGLTKVGTGTLALSNTNDYSGATNVNDGALRVNGSITSNTTVTSPGVLGGTGTITGNVGGNGTIDPGNSPGTLTIAGNFTPSGNVNFEINSPYITAGVDYDQIVVNGAGHVIDLSGATAVFISAGTPTPPLANVLTLIKNNTGTTIAPFSNLPQGALVTLGTSVLFSAAYNGNAGQDLVLSYVAVATTTTAVTSSANPSVFGQNVTFTATVTPTATGSVQFAIGGVNYGAPVPLNGSGVATISDSALNVGNYSVTATYVPDTSLFTGSTGSLAGGQTVNAADTTTNLSIVSKQVVATVAAVSPGGGIPTGSVQFFRNNVPFGNPVTLVNGQASIFMKLYGTITATYNPDTLDYNGSTSPPFVV